MRTRHTAHSFSAFPVYSSTFLSNDLLVLGGGGGSGKSGIKNRIRLYKVTQDDKLELLDELQLGDEDTPMSMATNIERKEIVCGINSTLDDLAKHKNENCRIYGTKNQKLHPLRKYGTFQTSDGEDYQNVTVFCPEQDLLMIGSTNNELNILWYDSFKEVYTPIRVDKGQLFDVTISSTTLVVTSSAQLQIHSLPNEKKSGGTLTLTKTVEPPTSPLEGLKFRAARFHPTNPEILYAILNATPPRSRASKSAPRHGFVSKWDTKTWKLIKIRKVAERAVTCFDVSYDGKLLAFGSSDYSVGIVDSITLAPLMTILKAHDFPPTTLKFNPDASLLVSGSADNSVRIIIIPENFDSAWPRTLFVLFALLILILAITLQRGILRL